MRLNLCLFYSCLSLSVFAACAPVDSLRAPVEFQNHPLTDARPRSKPAYQNGLRTSEDFDLPHFLDAAEETATPEGKRILQMGRSMIEAEVVVVGSCWDYIYAVYKRAGLIGHNETNYFASKKSGPYADPSALQAGDWLYIINHSFGDVEHSGIFIGWTDQIQEEALLLSYAGGNSTNPARYKVYDLSSVYNIIRPKAGVSPTLPPLVLPTPAPVSIPNFL